MPHTVLDYTTEQNFRDLFHSYATPLCTFLHQRYGDYEKAKDIVQESYIKLWNNRKSVATNKAKSFLFRTANNAYLNEIKHQNVVQRYQNNSQPCVMSSQESPDYLIEEKEFMLRLQTALHSLPDKQRKVFLMNRIEQLTYKEIADLLQISNKTVEKRMHLALRKMRAFLNYTA